MEGSPQIRLPLVVTIQRISNSVDIVSLGPGLDHGGPAQVVTVEQVCDPARSSPSRSAWRSLQQQRWKGRGIAGRHRRICDLENRPRQALHIPRVAVTINQTLGLEQPQAKRPWERKLDVGADSVGEVCARGIRATTQTLCQLEREPGAHAGRGHRHEFTLHRIRRCDRKYVGQVAGQHPEVPSRVQIKHRGHRSGRL